MVLRLRLPGVALVLGTLTACVAPRHPVPAPLAAPETLRVRTAGRIQSIATEDYVLGTALSEVTPVSAPPAAVARIYELQAVLARTYALSHLGRHQQDGFDLCDSTHCQLYEPGRIQTSRFRTAAERAVERTRGEVLVFSRRPAEALYHSDCGGHTASAEDVWGGAPVPYLTGTVDEMPALKHRTWTFEVPADHLRTALNLDPRSAIGRRLVSVAISSEDDSGRAARIEVRGERTQVLRGEDVRTILNRTFGDRAIMSTRLSVVRHGAVYRFTGSGFGHGVGLCQTGAAARAARGESVEGILSAYFPGAVLARAASGRSLAAANLLGPSGLALLRSP